MYSTLTISYYVGTNNSSEIRYFLKHLGPFFLRLLTALMGVTAALNNIFAPNACYLGPEVIIGQTHHLGAKDSDLKLLFYLQPISP